MKKICIFIFIILSVNALSVFCFAAQGSVNENNVLGAPAEQTSDTAVPDNGTVTYAAMTDTAADTTGAPTETVSDTASLTTDTTGENTDGKDNMTAVIILIIAILLTAAVAVTVMLFRKGKRD